MRITAQLIISLISQRDNVELSKHGHPDPSYKGFYSIEEEAYDWLLQVRVMRVNPNHPPFRGQYIPFDPDAPDFANRARAHNAAYQNQPPRTSSSASQATPSRTGTSSSGTQATPSRSRTLSSAPQPTSSRSHTQEHAHLQSPISPPTSRRQP